MFDDKFATTGKTVTGSFDGTLAADTITINVMLPNAYLVDGVATAATTVLGGAAQFGLGTAGPSLKLDKSVLDFAITATVMTAVAVSGVGNRIETAFRAAAGATQAFGGDDRFNRFVAAHFTGAIVTAAGVPALAAWALMIDAFARA